jgi:hypothetical protein
MAVSELYITAGSLGIVAVLSLLAFMMGFRASARIDGRAGLEALVAESEPGARIAEALIDARGRGALARLADGRLLVARAVGDKMSVRAMPARAVRLRLARRNAVLSFADLGYPQLSLRLGEAAPPAWLAALAAPAGETP